MVKQVIVGFILLFANSCFAYQTLILDRYRDLLFKNLQIDTDVEYGKNKTQAGFNKVLTMDIYQPANDTAKARPLIILAHGGFFLYGNKEALFLECDSLAQAGYVVATINYRLIDVEESVFSYKRAVVDAVHDMKASVRFFYKDAATINKYHIDTNNIFIGGFSAGAITSLHYAYVNTAQDVYPMGKKIMLSYIVRHGGAEGCSGNPGYCSKVRGVINLAGALHRASLVNAGEPVLFSVHGTDDDIVPFKTGTSGDSNVDTEGSGLIHPRADSVGVINKLIEVEGGDHLTYFIDGISYRSQLRNFVFENLKKE